MLLPYDFEPTKRASADGATIAATGAIGLTVNNIGVIDGASIGEDVGFIVGRISGTGAVFGGSEGVTTTGAEVAPATAVGIGVSSAG